MTLKTLLPLCAAFLLSLNLIAQDKLSWKKHVKLADQLYAEAQYADAAEHYEAAWRQKTKKKELIHKAAESYYIVKDYRKAAAAYEKVKDDVKDYPLAGLKYARCLKQDGEFDAASRELANYISKYEGEDKEIVEKIVPVPRIV